jgi:hypothetical protein
MIDPRPERTAPPHVGPSEESDFLALVNLSYIRRFPDEKEESTEKGWLGSPGPAVSEPESDSGNSPKDSDEASREALR